MRLLGPSGNNLSRRRFTPKDAASLALRTHWQTEALTLPTPASAERHGQSPVIGAIEATRARAMVGEISDARKGVYAASRADPRGLGHLWRAV
jgi:methylmalonyl-CoA mutase N-terminal domain/subunit